MEHSGQPAIGIRNLLPPILFFTLDGPWRNLVSASVVDRLEEHFKCMAAIAAQRSDDAGSRREQLKHENLQDYFRRLRPEFKVFGDIPTMASYADERRITPGQRVLFLDEFKGERSTRHLHVFFWGSSPEAFSPEENGMIWWKLLLSPRVHQDQQDQIVRQTAAFFGWRFYERLRKGRLPYNVPRARLPQAKGQVARTRNATERRGVTPRPPIDA